jgi:hypothetical protein
LIWGLTTSTFTTVHVVLSLVGIVSGLIVLVGFLRGRWLGGRNALFLVMTIATSVTGFAFPFDHLLPSHKVGILSLVVLALALVALYGGHLAGAWRRTYVICAMVALYLNCFVLVVMLSSGTSPSFTRWLRLRRKRRSRSRRSSFWCFSPCSPFGRPFGSVPRL